MKIKHTISILFMILLLASCKNGLTIFDQIDQETKLEDAVITGSVNSIVRSGDTLYASDGNIYSKDVNDVRGWSKIAGPGGTIIKLAADANKVYALTGEYDLDTRTYKNKKLFYLDAQNEWKSVVTSNISGEIKTIFDNGSGKTYLQEKKDGTYNYYDISDPSSISLAADITSTVILTRGDVTYTANGNTITAIRTSVSQQQSITLSKEVLSLSFSDYEQALYVGTKDGLKKLKLANDHTSDKILEEVSTLPGNWAATISNSQAFAVLATGTTADNAALYTSTIKGGAPYAKINGLWGYYYNRRSKWNRE